MKTFRKKPPVSIRSGSLRFNLRGACAVLLCALLFLAGSWFTKDQIKTVSNMQEHRELPVYCVQTDQPMISLTFDAAWGNDDTQKILDILAARNVKATFFMTGEWIHAFPDDVKKIAAAGHDIGNHSENHKNMSRLSVSEAKQEITQVHQTIKEMTGIDMKLFRPPYGDYDTELILTVKSCGYLPIQWDVDSLDWKNYGIDSIINTVTKHQHLGNGSIILMHNGSKYTAAALDTVIARLQEMNYQLVPLSKLVLFDSYHMNHEGRQIPDTAA